VRDGSHGKHEVIRDLKCQACGKEVHDSEAHDPVPAEDPFRDGRENPVVIGSVVDGSALEEVFGVREITIRAWLCRSGMQGRKLHDR